MRKLCRIIFSRYAVSALAILLELVLYSLLLSNLANLSPFWLILILLSHVSAVIAIINRNVNPEYKVSWIIVVTVLPIFGLVLYVVFYRRRMSRKDARHMEKVAEMHKRGAETTEGAFNELAKESPAAAGKAMAILSDDYLADVYTGTSSRIYPEGADMYRAMLTDLRRAERYIFLEFFIVEKGEMWNGIHEILLQKIAAGVEVRMLYDDIGCMSTLPSHYDRTLRAEGISCYRFGKITPKATAAHNNRDHRKILVIDGRVAYTGGINIADEYINRKERFGHWKDGGCRIVGSAVGAMVRLFLANYDLTSRNVSAIDDYLASVRPTESDGGYYIPFGSGPYPIYTRSTGKDAFIDLINQAQSYVYITTPYLIIDFDLTEALCHAAKRGVDVKIVTPHIPDKKLVYLMTKSAYPHLMKSGVSIYEYTPGFIHEKLVVADDLYAVVGTINFDYRSLAHHFENAVWMYGTPTVIDARDSYFATLSVSQRVTMEEAGLTFFEKVLRDGIRIFAPLL